MRVKEHAAWLRTGADRFLVSGRIDHRTGMSSSCVEEHPRRCMDRDPRTWTRVASERSTRWRATADLRQGMDTNATV